ncbi:hypothetical protein PESP_a0486 [Pseudoalteromonas espejiana DSM 9414]|uniref:Glycosyl transferase family 1 n=1 Tax=Pseudoalteromonas espejiana TaxID=28107 RepID=A0A510Y350_9GAMM|nr:glycosyltransferase [Pseudoalteromonas espejiana]ASM48730.1 hypothetical protein PESP_a0486 [Pseudoalteromonas espejiana DSM 9414]GEK57027.1 glycosyl transferase family 1 [Pseudoalteromonas espejiana]
MKKILHIVGKMNLGGTETYIMNLFRGVNKKNYTFDFLTYYSEGEEGYYDKEIQDLGGNIYKIAPFNFRNAVSFIRSIRRIIKEGEYDVVHAHTTYNMGFALYAAYKENVNIRIAHSHNTSIGERKSLPHYIYRKIMHFSINNYATHYFACSLAAANHMFTKFNVESNSYSYLPNAVELESFLSIKENNLRKDLNIHPKTKIIGHVGRFGKAKNHDFIIDIFNELTSIEDNYCLILIGEGASKSNIQERVNILGLNDRVRFLGQRNDIPDLMSIIDVFILPSLYEGFGIVLLEAQASGLPCVVSENIQPEPDMKLGLIHRVELQNKKQWLLCIKKLAHESKMPISTRELAIKNSNFILSKVLDKLTNTYESRK